jgi:peptide/nickel transport system permease protein
VSAPASDIAPAAGRFGVARRHFLGDPIGTIGLVLVVLTVGMGLFAPWLTPYDPFKIVVPDRLLPPSFLHPFGTDNLGRDVFSRVIEGSRIALYFAAVATGLSLVAGLVLGLLAGYGPRWADALFVMLFDTVNAFPRVMLALAVITILGPSSSSVLLVMIVTTFPTYARMVRTSTLALKNAEFVQAERSLGAGTGRILFRHVLPNVIGPMLILASMDIPVVITLEAGLTFLGLGVPPPAPSWGRILNEGYTFIREAPWIVVGGGIPLILATLGFTFLGESLRDVLDPKLRRGRR